MAFETGDRVEWDWAQGSAAGRIEEIHHTRISRLLKGSRIVRNGSAENPALVIRHEKGGEVLKLASEVRHA
ncbi:hypervirulence associated TUDOR domain-containing protein [Albibacillus kandeliae]|uniref:DUF2945 domain-containing protein n=1 Tax=Albibacillus kandeliae TaxID=2174228 RepID=UPI000D6A03D6|nr:DUF2945 domain-containing protein [Albibacillus kandeliae]